MIEIELSTLYSLLFGNNNRSDSRKNKIDNRNRVNYIFLRTAIIEFFCIVIIIDQVEYARKII